jgi:hypothetical protein
MIELRKQLNLALSRGGGLGRSCRVLFNNSWEMKALVDRFIEKNRPNMSDSLFDPIATLQYCVRRKHGTAS